MFMLYSFDRIVDNSAFSNQYYCDSMISMATDYTYEFKWLHNNSLEKLANSTFEQIVSIENLMEQIDDILKEVPFATRDEILALSGKQI